MISFHMTIRLELNRQEIKNSVVSNEIHYRLYVVLETVVKNNSIHVVVIYVHLGKLS